MLEKAGYELRETLQVTDEAVERDGETGELAGEEQTLLPFRRELALDARVALEDALDDALKQQPDGKFKPKVNDKLGNLAVTAVGTSMRVPEFIDKKKRDPPGGPRQIISGGPRACWTTSPQPRRKSPRASRAR